MLGSVSESLRCLFLFRSCSRGEILHESHFPMSYCNGVSGFVCWARKQWPCRTFLLVLIVNFLSSLFVSGYKDLPIIILSFTICTSLKETNIALAGTLVQHNSFSGQTLVRGP